MLLSCGTGTYKTYGLLLRSHCFLVAFSFFIYDCRRWEHDVRFCGRCQGASDGDAAAGEPPSSDVNLPVVFRQRNAISI